MGTVLLWILGILLGIVLVLLISASVSTLSSVTLTACSTMTMDFVKERIKKDLTENQMGTLSRILCLLFVTDR